MQALFNVNQMPINLLACGIIILLAFHFHFVLFDVVLIDFHEAGVPFFGIHAVYDIEYFRAHIVMNSLLVF